MKSNSIRGGMETERGMTVAGDESLTSVVVRAKLAKAIAAAGKDFLGKWSKSTKE